MLHFTSAQAIFDELVALVDPGVEPYKPKKGHTNVIMAVGAPETLSQSTLTSMRNSGSSGVTVPCDAERMIQDSLAPAVNVKLEGPPSPISM